MLCSYGCGKEAKFQFKNGKWCCGKSNLCCEGTRNKIDFSSPERIKKLSEAARNRIVSDVTREKLRKIHLGKKHPRSEEATEKFWNDDNIKKRKELKINKCINDPNRKILSFEEIDSEEKAYLLGFMYADACLWISKDKYKSQQLKIRLSIKDRDHLEKINAFFGRKISIFKTSIHTERYNKTYELVSIDLSDSLLIKQLMEKGFTYTKSVNDRTSDVFDSVPSNLRNHFIRGMVDGDGCIHKHKTRNIITFYICGINNVILEKINDELSLNCKIEKRKVEKIKNKNMYIFSYFRKNDIESIAHYLYDNATLYLERKRNIVLKYLC